MDIFGSIRQFNTDTNTIWRTLAATFLITCQITIKLQIKIDFAVGSLIKFYELPPCISDLHTKTRKNQQECSKLSNWFSLQCLGLRMNHLPPVLRSNLGVYVFNWQLMCKFDMVERSFQLIAWLCLCIIKHPKFAFYFSSHIILTWK